MIDLVARELRSHDRLSHFQIYIEVHTGPEVSGIMGINKWLYDIWGDTVNMASHIETNSEPGRTNISEPSYRQILAEF
jgi:class 3 adenylate cyclase